MPSEFEWAIIFESLFGKGIYLYNILMEMQF